jgi:hypothetical protein
VVERGQDQGFLALLVGESSQCVSNDLAGRGIGAAVDLLSNKPVELFA